MLVNKCPAYFSVFMLAVLYNSAKYLSQHVYVSIDWVWLGLTGSGWVWLGLAGSSGRALADFS